MDGSAGRGEEARSPQANGALRVSVRGVVQGVGFRPFVYALAHRHGVVGWVKNTSAGVEIHVEGTPVAVGSFAAALPREAPPRSRISSCTAVEAVVEGAEGFVILASTADPNAYQLVSPDLATCSACRRELLDPTNRRFEYPFTNCTDCGPRFTIIENLPYDRARTTMREFPLCEACRREYEDPGNRRFHAEPNACPVCGPRVRLLHVDAAKAVPEEQRGAWAPADLDRRTVELAAGSPEDPGAPIRAAAELLRHGEIIAVQGLGGFHVACDAADGAAVGRLKERKGRPHKPLAVMFADLDEVRRCCQVSTAEAALLTSAEQPIVLLDWNASASAAVDHDVAPGQRRLGVMLPYTPLHVLLLRAAERPLVMTSGNLAGEPLVRDWPDAARLAMIADAFLVHDRAIAQRCDDSVAVVRRGHTRLLRRARGYAPLPLALSRALPQTLACGAELKSAFCLTRERDAFLSQHIGDLENLETLEHYEASVRWHERLFRVLPEVIAYDLHPEYLASKYAAALPQKEKVAVQHHHAHVAARLVECGREGPVIGVSMDGLGYGDDGRLWGGEVLVCDLLGYRRVAHLEEMPLAGGAAAIRAPWRSAAGWSYALLGEEGLARAARLLTIGADDAPDAESLGALRLQIDAGVNAPLTTSAGRLFDAVSALAGVRRVVTYEGQAAVELEALAATAAGAPPYPVCVAGEVAAAALSKGRTAASWVAAHAAGEVGADPATLRLAPILSGVLDDLDSGLGAAVVGARLHATMAAFVLETCAHVRRATGLSAVALVGGVFQNRVLSDLCESGLEAAGFEVLPGGLVPCNDGGLALGQAAVGGYTVLERRGEYRPPEL